MQKTITLSLTALFLVSFLVGVAPMATAGHDTGHVGPLLEDQEACEIPIVSEDSASCDEYEKNNLCFPVAGDACTEDVVDVFAGDGEETGTIGTAPEPCDFGDPEGDAPDCLIPESDCEPDEIYVPVLDQCVGEPAVFTASIENEEMTSDNGNSDWAKDGDTITLTFESSDPIQNVEVSFYYDDAGTPTLIATESATSQGLADDIPPGTKWTASTTAPDAAVDGAAITAAINYQALNGDAQPEHNAGGGVTLDNVAPQATIDFTNADDDGVVDSSPASPVVTWDLTVTEGGALDPASTVSSHDWNNGDGTTGSHDPVPGTGYDGDIPSGGTGTFTVDVTVADMAGNTDTKQATVLYDLPSEPDVTLTSDNTKGNTSLAMVGDTITLRFVSTVNLEGFSLTSLHIGGDNVTGDAATDTTDLQDVTVTYTVSASSPEGEVTFAATWADLDAPHTTTMDGLGVTVDVTPPAIAITSSQILADGTIGVGPGEDILLSIVVDADLDNATSSGVITSDPTPADPASDDEVPFTVAFDTLDGVLDEGAGTLTYDVTVDHFGGGELRFDFTLEDMAGNSHTPVLDPIDVFQGDERVTATITENDANGANVNGDKLHVGLGDASQRTYYVEVTHVSLASDPGDVQGVSYISIDFDLDVDGDAVSVGDAFSVVSMSHPNALLGINGDGEVTGIEIELDDELKDGVEAFTFTVENDEEADDGPMATGQAVGIAIGAQATDFSTLGGGTLAATSVVADIDGPDITGHEYPIADGDTVIDYLEFVADPDGIVAALSGITDVGGSGAVGVVVGHGPSGTACGDPDFVQLGENNVFTGTSADVPLDHTQLNSGDRYLIACATDALGNQGPPSEVLMDIAIRQYIIVTPDEDEVVWVSPDGAALVDFNLTPVDVVQDIKRYDLRTPDGDFALSSFLGGGASSFVNTNGELRLVRFSSPANDASLEITGVSPDGVVFGFEGAEHGETSAFTLTVLNNKGEQDVFEVVTGPSLDELVPFTGPLFTAKVDSMAPVLSFDGFTEPPADADSGKYDAEPGGTLTFEFTVADADSGLPDTGAVGLEVFDGDSWSSVAGAVLDMDAGTIQIARETPGQFTYRLTAVDNVTNTAHTDDIVVDVRGSVEAAVESIEVTQGGVALDGPGAVLYADMDSTTPDEDVDASDEVEIVAHVTLGGAVEENVQVNLSFDGTELSTLTNETGHASWTIDPDTYGLDLESTFFLVSVPEQEVGENDNIVVVPAADTRSILWTGFYIEAGGDEQVAPGSTFTLFAAIYWLHDVVESDGAINTTGRTPASAFDDVGTIGFLESVGDPGLSHNNVDPTTTMGGEVGFSLTRGTAPTLGDDTPSEAGYRMYMPDASGSLFPFGMDGQVLTSSHEVLVSAVRLVVDDAVQFGDLGDDAPVTVTAEWLHELGPDGNPDSMAVPGMDVTLAGGEDPVVAALGDTQPDTVVLDGILPIGAATFTVDGDLLAGSFPTIYGATVDVYGVDTVLSSVTDATLAPGDAFDGHFTVTVDGTDVTPDFAGVGASLDITHTGALPDTTEFTAEPFGSQTPFSVFMDGQDLAATVSYNDTMTRWEFTLPDADFGAYTLDMGLVVSDQNGVPFSVNGSSAFDIAHKLYLISHVSTEDAGFGAPADVVGGTEFWFDRTDASEVTHTFKVEAADWNGTTATNHADAANGVVLALCNSIDGGANWDCPTEEEITLENGDGTASFTHARPSDTPEDVLYRLVVIEDSGVTMTHMDGVHDATVPYEVEFIFTGISVAFDGSGDQLGLVGESLGSAVTATYDHDGSPVDGMSVTFTHDDDETGVADATNSTGGLAVSYSLGTPGNITGLTATASGAPHGLVAPAPVAYAGTLKWVDVTIGDLLVEESTSEGYVEVVGTDGVYTVDSGKVVRVTVPVVLFDGTTTVAVDGGDVQFGSASPTPIDSADGTAEKSYFRSSPGSSGTVGLDILGATLDGQTFGDVLGAGSFEIVWE